MAAAGGIDMFAHLGPTGLVIGGIAAYVAYRHAPDVYGHLPEEMPAFSQMLPAHQPSSRSFADRLLGRFPDEQIPSSEVHTDEDDNVYVDEDELDELLSPRSGQFQFSDVLQTFTPSLRSIYLATLPDGTPIYSDAKGLCHVALAGSTGRGKSCLIRLLMSQLCKAGASVLLLNPHYTRYDLESDEDWTPFEPYLVYDPMECRKYEVIEHYLKQVATVLLPKRLDKYAHSQPLGKPYFIVIDELPAIVRHVKNAPDYIASILQEGRKVGIFLITSAQDFLVKTIGGDGAPRKCYRTALNVGGDPTTARVLGVESDEDNVLGKGTVMLRCQSVPKTLVHVPYVDNEALYTLLGPSTYVAESPKWDDDRFLEDLAPNPYRSPRSVSVQEAPENRRETASEANPKIEGEVFPVSSVSQETPSVSIKETSIVGNETRETIKRMMKKGMALREIALLVGLSGRKYSLFQEVCRELGIE